MGLWNSCGSTGCSNTLQISDGKNLVLALRFFMMASIFTTAFTIIAIIAAAADKLKEGLYRVMYACTVVTTVFTFISMCLFAAYFNDVLMPLSGNGVSADYCYFLCIASFFTSIVCGLFVYAIWKMHTGGASNGTSLKSSSSTPLASTSANITSPPKTTSPSPSYPAPTPIAVSKVPSRAPPPRGAPPPPPKSTLPANWIAYTTDEGEPYYYNTSTQETRWELPT